MSILKILPVDDQRREVVSCSDLITYWSSGLPVQIFKIQIPGPTVDLPNKKWGAVRGLGELELCCIPLASPHLHFSLFHSALYPRDWSIQTTLLSILAFRLPGMFCKRGPSRRQREGWWWVWVFVPPRPSLQVVSSWRPPSWRSYQSLTRHRIVSYVLITTSFLVPLGLKVITFRGTALSLVVFLYSAHVFSINYFI